MNRESLPEATDERVAIWAEGIDHEKAVDEMTNTEALTIFGEMCDHAEDAEMEPEKIEAMGRAFQALRDVVDQEGCR